MSQSFTVQELADLHGTNKTRTHTVQTGSGSNGQSRARALMQSAWADGLEADWDVTARSGEFSVTLSGNAFEVVRLVIAYERANPS